LYNLENTLTHSSCNVHEGFALRIGTLFYHANISIYRSDRNSGWYYSVLWLVQTWNIA